MRIVVSNIAFSKNKFLVDQLNKNFKNTIINEYGKRFSDDELIEYYAEADGIIVGLETINDNILSRLPNLKIISKFGVGLDNIDLIACKKRNIQVGWTGGVNKRSVSEMALGFMLMLSRNLYLTSNQLKKKYWNKNGGSLLSGKTIGIIGLGYIGRDLLKLLEPFNCKILINDLINLDNLIVRDKISISSKEKIYKNSDIISLHIPHTNKTNLMIDYKEFKLMKKNLILINTSRGNIVNEDALKNALLNNDISGAALDVYSNEPPEDVELIKIPNLITTPHIGGNAIEAVISMGMSALEHLIKFKVNKK